MTHTPPSPTLVVDAAHTVLSIAVLGEGGHVLASFKEDVWRDMAARLHPAVGQVLQAANLSLADLAALYVNTGPGSFTSIRIGIAAVKAFSFALAVPAYGASGFEAMAHPFLNKGHPIGVWLEATSGEVYCQYFSEEGIPLGVPLSALPQEALKHCPERALIVGNIDFSIVQLPESVRTQKVDIAPPQAIQSVAEEGPITPLYVRPLKYKKTT